MSKPFRIVSVLAVLFACSIALPVRGAIPASERSALVALYDATNGATWTRQTNWLGSPGTECSWFGVRCDESSSSVVEIELLNNGLLGMIPEEIADLTQLTWLDLSGNDLEGPIPEELATLSKLEFFGGYSNRIGGQLPPELGLMPALEFLLLGNNEIVGVIPDEFRQLTQLESLDLHGNQLTGDVPEWIAELASLVELKLGGNRLTGSIPDEITSLASLALLDLAGNRLTGAIPSDIGDLVGLEELTLEENDLSGEIPGGVWTLTALVDLRLGGNRLTGSLSPQIGNLVDVVTLYLENNQLDGEIPSEVGYLSSVTRLALGGNRLTGEIPAEVGQMTRLEKLDLGRNALGGSIPAELMNLANLAEINLGFNALVTYNDGLRSFVNAIHTDGTFEETQTVPPENVTVDEVTDRSTIVSWTPIEYTGGDGGYEVTVTPAGGGATVIRTTASKEMRSISVRGLMADTGYNVTVRTTTHPHGLQQNFIRSEASTSVPFHTTAKVVAPALVDIVSRAGALVQVGGEPESSTSYTLTNFGDVATEIIIDQDESFFIQSPSTFTLDPGGRQIVTVQSVPNQAEGFHWGRAYPMGEGVAEGLSVTIQLLSVASTSSEAVAVAVTKRIEVTGDPNTDTIGSVSFDNAGTSTLNGLLVSDAAWIDVPNDLIVIRPGERESVTFTVRRSRRPDADLGGVGTLFATLRLIYVDGPEASKSVIAPRNGTDVSEVLVTVVDTTAPSAGSSSIPPIESGEPMRVVSGVIQQETIASNLYLTNAFGFAVLTDLQIFFQPTQDTAAFIASFDSVAPSQSVALASVVGSVFGGSDGTLFVRSQDQNNLLVSAHRIVTSDSGGSYAESIPVFLSDRGIGPGEELSLTGVREDGSFTSTLYVQEVSGAEAKVVGETYDSAGNTLGETLTIDSIAAFGLVQTNALPVGATSIILRNDDDSSGEIVAWVMVSDLVTGDGWAVADWRRCYGLAPDEAIRVPLVVSSGKTSSRRRGVRRPELGSQGSGGTLDADLTSSLALFNPDVADAVVEIEYWEAGTKSTTTVVVASKTTQRIDDVSTFVRGLEGRSTGYVVLTPLTGSVAVTTRIAEAIEDGGTRGTGVPAVGAGSGLRLGQDRLFAGLSDSTRATVDGEIPGTTRTSFGIAEVAGHDVTVRATLLVFDGASLAGATVSRDFTVKAHQVLVVNDMARAILGEQRETLFGEMNNLQLDLRVVAGDGAASVFVLSEDNGSKDLLLRVE